jgi:Flp pilus assembly pilin Flp
MLGRAAHDAARALAERKGATSLEYALLAASLAAAVMVGFNAFFSRFGGFLAGISF